MVLHLAAPADAYAGASFETKFAHNDPFIDQHRDVSDKVWYVTKESTRDSTPHLPAAVSTLIHTTFRPKLILAIRPHQAVRTTVTGNLKAIVIHEDVTLDELADAPPKDIWLARRTTPENYALDQQFAS
jgi:hypothetical protein